MKQEMFDFLMGTLIIKQHELICKLLLNLRVDLEVKDIQYIDKTLDDCNKMFEAVTSVRKIETQPEYPMAN